MVAAVATRFLYLNLTALSFFSFSFSGCVCPSHSFILILSFPRPPPTHGAVNDYPLRSNEPLILSWVLLAFPPFKVVCHPPHHPAPRAPAAPNTHAPTSSERRKRRCLVLHHRRPQLPSEQDSCLEWSESSSLKKYFFQLLFWRETTFSLERLLFCGGNLMKTMLFWAWTPQPSLLFMPMKPPRKPTPISSGQCGSSVLVIAQPGREMTGT